MTATRSTDWITTASGRRFWPLEPRVEDVAIEDIAHHLSHLCRFAGAVRTFYSVAEHSVRVSLKLSIEHAGDQVLSRAPDRDMTTAQVALYGLLHDASEAYLADIPTPLKRAPKFAAYREAEAQLQAVIYRAFGLVPALEPPRLKLVDRRMLRTEQRDLMPPPGPGERRDDAPPYLPVLSPMTSAEAHQVFLARFVELTWQAWGLPYVQHLRADAVGEADHG